MRHSQLFVLVLIFGLSSQLAMGQRLSHDEITMVSNLVLEAATKSEYLFETGDPEPSKDIPAFDRLRKMLTERYAADLAVLLAACGSSHRSEEHTSELQSLRHLVCRLLL